MAVNLFHFEDDEIEGLVDFLVLKKLYSEEDSLQGIRLLEKLISMDLDGVLEDDDTDDIRYSIQADVPKTGTVEHILEKFCVLLDGRLLPPADLTGLSELYRRLPIALESNIDSIMEELVREYGNSSHNNDQTQARRYSALRNQAYVSVMDIVDAYFLKTFSLEDRKKYGGVNQKTGRQFPAMQFFQSIGKDKTDEQLTEFLGILDAKEEQWQESAFAYAYTWVGRNMKTHALGKLKKERKDVLKRCYWRLLLDTCFQYEDEINNTFLESILSELAPDKFKEKLKNEEKERLALHDKRFTQLSWNGSKVIEWPYKDKKPLLLLGEAGAGKTTQMVQLYADTIRSEELKVYPLWIAIRDLSEFQGPNELITCIKKKMGRYAGWYDDVMREGLVMLFLDGLNELLVDDNGVMKSKMFRAIADIVKRYPKVKICMTDRILQAGMDRDLPKCYYCAGMDKEEQGLYCSKNCDSEAEAEQVMTYLDSNKSPLNQWVDKTVLTPQKMNVIIRMVRHYSQMLSEIKTVDQSMDVFWYCYVKTIMEREGGEKGDANTEILTSLFQMFIKKKNEGLTPLEIAQRDFKFTKEEIMTFFTENSSRKIEGATEYYRLASSIPLIEADENGMLGFAHYSFYRYFMKGGNLKNGV